MGRQGDGDHTEMGGESGEGEEERKEGMEKDGSSGRWAGGREETGYTRRRRESMGEGRGQEEGRWERRRKEDARDSAGPWGG